MYDSCRPITESLVVTISIIVAHNIKNNGHFDYLVLSFDAFVFSNARRMRTRSKSNYARVA